jgi:hypothetical protein
MQFAVRRVCYSISAAAAGLAVIAASIQDVEAQEQRVFAASVSPQPVGEYRTTMYEGRLVAGQLVDATSLWTEPTDHHGGRPIVLGGGRWIAYETVSAATGVVTLIVYDRSTGATSRLPLGYYGLGVVDPDNLRGYSQPHTGCLRNIWHA